MTGIRTGNGKAPAGRRRRGRRIRKLRRIGLGAGIAAAAVFAAVCGALLKRGQKEIALLFSLAAAVLVFLCILPQIETLTSTFREWAELSGMPEVFGALLKALGIVLIGRITADLCKDAGESAIASGVELAVKTAVLLTALPLLNRLLSLLQEVLLL